MKFIKLIVISFAVIAILITVVSFIFPSTVIVSRASNINVPKDSIMPLVKDFYGWKKWIIGLNDSSVKIISATDANLAGTNVKITKADSTGIVSEWTSRSGKKMTGEIHLINNASNPNVTVVQWQFQQKLKWYPWEKFASLMSDKILGPMMEAALAQLQRLAEKTS